VTSVHMKGSSTGDMWWIVKVISKDQLSDHKLREDRDTLVHSIVKKEESQFLSSRLLYARTCLRSYALNHHHLNCKTEETPLKLSSAALSEFEEVKIGNANLYDHSAKKCPEQRSNMLCLKVCKMLKLKTIT
jgi:hypothetical protein